MGNSKSKQQCFLRGCALDPTDSRAYNLAVDELMFHTNEVWPLNSKAPYYFGVVFESLRRDPNPPAVKEYKKMTKKGYTRVSYRARTVYTLMRSAPEIDGFTPPGNAMLYVPVASIQYSGWTKHGVCARESAPTEFKLEMLRLLIDKTEAMVNEKKASLNRRLHDGEKIALVEGLGVKSPFDSWLDAMAKDMSISGLSKKDLEKQALLFDDSDTFVPSEGDFDWLAPNEIPYDYVSAEMSDDWSRF